MSARPPFHESVRSEFARLELREVLQASPDVLLGVSAEAAATLAELKLLRVFDLAMSSVFAVARAIYEAAGSPSTAVARFGSLPSEMVDIPFRDTPPTELLAETTAALDGIGPDLAEKLRTTVGVATIREMALWPPFRTARDLTDQALEQETLTEADEESPPELVPKLGEFYSDKVFYNSIVMIDAPNKALHDLSEHGPIDLSGDTSPGFTTPATGAILTYSQAWNPIAVALGHLLYSLPLAPGESTKIAVIDYARRTSASTVEELSQTETLSNTLVQSRSISEVAQAVATELQTGESESTSASDSESIGVAAGGFISPVLFGGALGASRNSTTASTFTTSKGERELSAKNQQKINSSTQQNAFAERNKKAAIIAEATQDEREQLTTRSVTNYNHMHALSIHYYEVVQLYRTEVRLERCERALFIPMQPFKFSNDTVARFRSVLFRAALNERIRQLLIFSVGSIAATLELRPGYRFIEKES